MTDKYRPLTEFLRATPLSLKEVTLSFPQIELIIGEKLPASHIQYRQWWENQKDNKNRPQAQGWMKAGFEVIDLDLNAENGWVRFTRIRNSGFMDGN